MILGEPLQPGRAILSRCGSGTPESGRIPNNARPATANAPGSALATQGAGRAATPAVPASVSCIADNAGTDGITDTRRHPRRPKRSARAVPQSPGACGLTSELHSPTSSATTVSTRAAPRGATKSTSATPNAPTRQGLALRPTLRPPGQALIRNQPRVTQWFPLAHSPRARPPWERTA